MTFVDCLEEYLDTHTCTSLAKQIGCNPSSITDYRDGVEPKPDRKAQIAEIIGYTENEPEYKAEIEYVDPKEAAARMGMTEYSLMCALRDKALPFALVFRGNGEKFIYKIIRKDFEDFIEKHKMPQ